MQESDGKSGVSYHIKSEVLGKGKWVQLHNITYCDPTGKTRSWEAVGRTTRCTGEADAVGIISTFKDYAKDDQCVILVRQYRPPMQTYTVEFPAGLIDAGETAEEAAVREMKEETGYDIQVNKVLPATALDPGLGNTTLKFAVCQIDMSQESNKNPKAVGGGDDEFVQVIVEPLSSLMDKLDEHTARGDVVDSRVYIWALGLCAAP